MFIFPVHLFNPAVISATVRQRVIDGGTSLSGDQDVIAADGGGRWEVTFGEIAIRNPDIERYWKQWNSYLLGGARVVAVPLLSLRTAPRPSAGARVMRVGDLYTDDKVFPNVARYGKPYIVATVVNAVAIRATQMTINVEQGARIQGGETFSVGNRAFVIERVLSQTGQTATVVTSPPARAAIAAGATANFDWPVVQAKLAIGQDLATPLNFGYGSASISFVEDFSNAA